MAEFDSVVNRRQMCRSFLVDPVSKEDVEAILKAALAGPSAGFSQGFEYLVLSQEQDRLAFWSAVTSPEWRKRHPERSGLFQAPIIMVPFACKDEYLQRYGAPDKSYSSLDKEQEWPVPYWYIDTAFSSMLALLKVVDLGLQALFFGIFRGLEELRARFGIPDRVEPIGAIAVGHSDGIGVTASPNRRIRRSTEEMVHWGKFDS